MNAVDVPSGEDPRDKRLGAYYTDSQVADFLARWALRKPDETVADPSFGGGIFLRAAANWTLALGGDPRRTLFGVEMDEGVHRLIAEKTASEFGLDADRLICDDFFALPSGALAVDAIVGNPPFIRFHSFTGEARRLALTRTKAAGVVLSGASSSWAPFVVHSATMLNPGGRLAMVVPAEIGYAEYAAPVVRFLCERFASVTLVTFERPLFPHLSEDTYLLLAEGNRQGSCETIRVEGYRDIGSLLRSQDAPAVALDAEALITRRQRFSEAFIDADARDAYDRLAVGAGCYRLGDLANVGIGYVSGANGFFHLSVEEARQKSIVGDVLRPSLLNGRGLNAALVGERDWELAETKGDAGLLLHVERDGQLSGPVSDYLQEGITADVPTGYKCRMRKPWYRVPGVHVPDAFLTYMSGNRPRLAVNVGGFVAPNTLHTIRLKPASQIDARDLLVWWHSSLARLSAELEGHALGGGMLKIEPREAARLLVPAGVVGLGKHAEELDAMLREERHDDAERLADRVLCAAVGVEDREMRTMATAAETLCARRMGRGR